MKNKTIIIILSIFLVISLGVGGFFAYKYFDSKKETTTEENKNTNNKEENENNKISSITENEATEIINSILDDMHSCDYLETFTNDKKVEVKDLSNIHVYNTTLKKIYRDSANNAKQTIALDELKDGISKYYGKDYTFDPNNIDSSKSCPGYSYNESSKEYTLVNLACGNACGPHTTYKYADSSIKDDVLTINIKVVFSDGGNSYSDYARTKVIEETDYEARFNYGADYKFTFKLEDGNYVFVSSEPIK